MKYKNEYIKTIDYWSIIISDNYDGGTVMFIYHGGTIKMVGCENQTSIWSLPHSAVHSWLRSHHMKKQRSTLYRKWASYGFHMRNTKIHNSYSEKIKSSYIVIEHTHCYHHTSQSQFGSFSLQGSLWHFVYLSIWHFLIIIKFDY